MTARSSQKLTALSFIIGSASALIILGSCGAMTALRNNLHWLLMLLGFAGWLTMFTASAIVLFHTNPKSTRLGLWALANEKQNDFDCVSLKRKLSTVIIVGIALLSVATCVLSVTGLLSQLLEKYLFKSYSISNKVVAIIACPDGSTKVEPYEEDSVL